MLALEDQLVADVASSGEGALAGDLVLGASTGPAAVAIPVALAEFQRQNPDVRVFLTVSDTHSVVERVAARVLELGIVGAARRHRGVRFEPFFSDQVILACPPGHPQACCEGPHVSTGASWSANAASLPKLLDHLAAPAAAGARVSALLGAGRPYTS